MSYYVTNENSVLNINNAHLKVSGNVMTDVMKLGAIEFAPPASDVGGTVNFTNVTTGVTTSSNLSVGGTLSLGTVEVVATTHTLANTTANGNVTPHTVQFSNATTGIVTTANVEVGGELAVTGNVAVDTDTLFVDSVNDRVGIGTTTPGSALDVVGDAVISSNLVVGTNKLFVDTVGGNVGIGTTSPGTTLDVFSTTGTQMTLRSDSRYSTIFAVDDTGSSFFGNDRGAIRFTTGGDTSGSGASEKMRILASGNVGIGTTSPTQKLDVNGYIKQTNTYFFVSDTTTSFTAARIFGNTELIDRGGNWSTTTKRFTAPVKGLYTFTFNGFTVNDQHYGLGYNSDNPDTGNYQTKQLWSINGGTGGSHTWTLEMEASDYITLRLYNAGNLSTNRCYFMGGLLYAV